MMKIYRTPTPIKNPGCANDPPNQKPADVPAPCLLCLGATVPSAPYSYATVDLTESSKLTDFYSRMTVHEYPSHLNRAL